MSSIMIDDWRFSFDREKTVEYYRSFDNGCLCDACKNFYENVSSISDDIKGFLEQFGVDIRKPVEQDSYLKNRQQKKVSNILYYAVKGTVSEIGESVITIDDTIIEIVELDRAPNVDMFSPYFVFAVCDIVLPWSVSENIEEYYG